MTLSFLKAEHALLDAAGDDEVVHEHRIGLAYSISSVGGLRLSLRIPPRFVMNDRVGARQIETRTACFQAHQKHIRLAVLKRIDGRLAIARRTRERRVADPTA